MVDLIPVIATDREYKPGYILEANSGIFHADGEEIEQPPMMILKEVSIREWKEWVLSRGAPEDIEPAPWCCYFYQISMD